MKTTTTISKFLLWAFALQLSVACEGLLPSVSTPSEGNLELTVKPQMLSFTKATDTHFENEDEVGVFVIVPEWETPLWADNIKFKIDQNGTLSAEEALYWYDDMQQSAYIMSYYPYSETCALPDELTFTVNADQSTHELYTSSDLMFACKEAKPSAQSVPLTYNHMLSKVVINIDNELNEDITDIYFAEVYGSVKVNVSTDNSTEYAVQGSKGTIKMAHASDADGKDVWAAIIVPQNDAMPELIVTTASRQYTYTMSSSVSFEPGTKSEANILLDGESLSTDFTPDISEWLPGNDLNFGQEDTGDSDENEGSDMPAGTKKLYYSTTYCYGDEQKAILWYDNEVHELELPDGIQYPMASGVVKDRDGNLIVGGGYDGSDVEWRPMIWKNGQAELFSMDEGLIIDVDIAADGDILLCNYGSDREYYTKGTTKIYHPEGFNPTSMTVSGEDIYFSGYVIHYPDGESGEYEEIPAYVRNGELTCLEGNGQINSLTVYDGHLYMIGEIIDYSTYICKAFLWIDGVAQELHPSYQGSTYSSALFVDATGVYTTVQEGDGGDFYLWKDGQLTGNISNFSGNGSENEYGWIEDMYVLDGEIYMGGFLNSGNGNSPHAVIWHMTDCSSEADCIKLAAGEAERGRFYFG